MFYSLMLIIAISTPNGQVIDQSYAIDYNMTLQDCQELLVTYKEDVSFECILQPEYIED